MGDQGIAAIRLFLKEGAKLGIVPEVAVDVVD
jgi:hypothetical protein